MSAKRLTNIVKNITETTATYRGKTSPRRYATNGGRGKEKTGSGNYGQPQTKRICDLRTQATQITHPRRRATHQADNHKARRGCMMGKESPNRLEQEYSPDTAPNSDLLRISEQAPNGTCGGSTIGEDCFTQSTRKKSIVKQSPIYSYIAEFGSSEEKGDISESDTPVRPVFFISEILFGLGWFSLPQFRKNRKSRRLNQRSLLCTN